MKFPLGNPTATPGALEALEQTGVTPMTLLSRHAAGDWGDLDKSDRRENEDAVKHGGRIFSAYQITNSLRIWVITEADRSNTCLLLPEEY